ncbi:MAG: HAMP domain-containing histidine kinase [Oscillospiraceae bacterium]|nr:HAMP domain-containing histidine kinase [Oscillospiraceae bacterium]
MKLKKLKAPVNRLGVKLSLLILIITVAADMLTFTGRIVIDMLMSNGNSDTEEVIAAVISSIVIGTLLSFIAGGMFLKPLGELIKATKKVSDGDYSAQVDIGWAEKHTVRELSDLIGVFNEMTRELNNTAMFNKDFIASFSHEFKTPLVSIRGFARQLYDGNLTPEQQKEFSKIILEETEYLSDLSANTLLLTSLETSDIVSGKTEFSLDEQLRSCMLRLEPQWSEKNIDLSMELDEVKFYWDERMLAHVWNNLFDNAVKFTPEGGRIYVSCHRNAGVITIRVRDSGVGIPQQSLPHIFEKFYQADSSHATKGNGLGLPLAKKIVELCGGRIGVKSDLGKGAEFTVILPDGGNLLGQNGERAQLHLNENRVK